MPPGCILLRYLARPALLGLPFWLIASLSLGAGYLASMTVGFLAVKRRGARQLIKQVPLMPLYWLLISGAAYRAIWQFMTDRFAWERTEHGVSHFRPREGRRPKPEIRRLHPLSGRRWFPAW